jgi:quercetin dioxygenase-like cupin family protein
MLKEGVYMEIYRYDSGVGRTINAFDSKNVVMTKIIQESGEFHIGCMHLSEQAVVGYHQATVNQLFDVVQGSGTVRNGDSDFIGVQAGEAIFWEKGEGHETISKEGLWAIVIEGETVKPAKMMERIKYWQKKVNQSEFLALQASDREGVLKLKLVDDRIMISGQAIIQIF